MADTIIRVAIVDDHAIVRSGLANFLDAFDDLILVGESDNGADARWLCQQKHPDVVLMDLSMPGINGVQATQLIKESFPEIQVLILTSFADDEMVQNALNMGAIGYLLKNSSIHEMARAIRLAYQGKTFLSPEAAMALIHRGKNVKHKPILKDREQEILMLLSQGLTNQQIADRLALSLPTIKFYVSSIMEKLNASTRTEAVVLAMQVGLIHNQTDHAL